MSQIAPPVQATEPVCPLCRKPAKPGQAKLLYGHPICKKCYYKFANRRQGAFLIDIIVWRILETALIFALVFGLATRPIAPETFDTVGLLGWPLFLIFFLKDGFQGYSLGKVICGVQVIDQTTRKPIGFGASFKRNLPLLIPFGVLILAIQEMKGHRWGDKWSNSMVIWKKYAGSHVFGASGTCENCQYDLFGNESGICPECGTPVSQRNLQAIALRKAQGATLDAAV